MSHIRQRIIILEKNHQTWFAKQKNWLLMYSLNIACYSALEHVIKYDGMHNELMV